MPHAKTYEEALKKDAERFWSKVDKKKRKDGCWIWKGRAAASGRGQYAPGWFKGVPVIEGRETVQAHVWAWVLTHGNRPLGHGLQRGSSGTVLRHTCGNGNIGCVNPHHLRVGTQGDNNRETRAMGRALDQQLEKMRLELERVTAELKQLKAVAP